MYGSSENLRPDQQSQNNHIKNTRSRIIWFTQVSLTRDSKHVVKHVRMAFLNQITQSYHQQATPLFLSLSRSVGHPLKASISDWDTIAYSSVDVDGKSKHPRKAETADSVSQIYFSKVMQSFTFIQSNCNIWTGQKKSSRTFCLLLSNSTHKATMPARRISA